MEVKPFETDMFRSDLEELSTITSEAGITLILAAPAVWFSGQNVAGMYLSWPYLDESWWKEARISFPAIAKEFAETHDIAYLDLSESVQGHEELLMTDFLHFNNHGADVIGRRIALKLLGQKRASDISHAPMLGRVSAMSEAFH